MRFKERLRLTTAQEQLHKPDKIVFDDADCIESEDLWTCQQESLQALEHSGLHDGQKQDTHDQTASTSCTAPSSSAPDVDITFIGTGSAQPSKYRGPSAILLQFAGTNVLLEAGENTVGSLERLRGKEQAVVDIRSLSCICVSHAHADHILGLPSIVQRWKDLHSSTELSSNWHLVVVGPSVAHSLLKAIGACDDGKVQFMQWNLGFEQVISEHIRVHSVEVTHIPSAAAFWLELKRKSIQQDHMLNDAQHCCYIGFSGDCRPSQDLKNLLRRRGVDVIIHEATFEDNLQDHAHRKKHCTVGEALGVTAGAHPRHGVILTHFSQRYPGIPTIPQDAPAVPAFDGMTLRPPETQVLSDHINQMDCALTCEREQEQEQHHFS